LGNIVKKGDNNKISSCRGRSFRRGRNSCALYL